MRLSLTIYGQLLADEHINNARAAKARAQGDDALRFAFHLAVDTKSRVCLSQSATHSATDKFRSQSEDQV